MGPASRPRSLRRLAGVAAGVVAGAVTAVLGTAAHLVVARLSLSSAGVELPVGLLLAVTLVASTDLALAAATLSPAALVATGAGRALALLPFLLPDPGGKVVVTGSLVSTVWVLLAILFPLFLAAPLSGLARRRQQAAAT